MSLAAFKKFKEESRNNNAATTGNTTQKTGLIKDNSFPNLPLLSSDGSTILLHSAIKRKTLIIFQPGTSHTDQWKGRENELALWKTISGAAGCTDQLKNWVAQAKMDTFPALETDIIIIMSNKTADNLADIIKNREVPFPIYALSPEGLQTLKDAGYACFEFEGNTYPSRSTFLVDSDKCILHVMDRKQDKPEACVNEAERTLEAVKTLKLKPIPKPVDEHGDDINATQLHAYEEDDLDDDDADEDASLGDERKKQKIK